MPGTTAGLRHRRAPPSIDEPTLMNEPTLMTTHAFPLRCALPAICLFMLAFAACEDEDNGTTDIGGSDPDGCTEFVIPNTWGQEWDDLSHRVSKFQMLFDGSGCTQTTLNTELIGGDFSTGEFATDFPIVDAAWQRVRGDVTRIAAARYTHEVTLRGEVSQTSVTLNRGALNLDGYSNVNAVIEGFAFDTDTEQRDEYPYNEAGCGFPEENPGYEPRCGYTARAFRLSADVSEVTDTTIVLDLSIGMLTGTSDRANMNEAMAVANIAARLDLLIIGTSGVPVHRADISYTDAPPYSFVCLAPEDVPSDLRTLNIDGSAGSPAGAAGFSSLSFAISPGEIACDADDDCHVFGETCVDSLCTQNSAPHGVYVRGLRASLTQTSYEQTTGRAAFDVEGWVSNCNIITILPMRNEFSAGVVWFQAEGAVSEEVIRQKLDGLTGEFEITP